MIEFVELHDVGNGMPIAIPAEPFAIACIEPVEDEDGKRIGTIVSLRGIKEGWISVRETYEEVKELFGWNQSFNKVEIEKYLTAILKREETQLETLALPPEEATWHTGYKACVEDLMRDYNLKERE